MLDTEANQLHLEPEHERDQTTAERLRERYQTFGFGRHAETGEILHLQVVVTPREWTPAAAD